ncbi:MAG: hypothetical protein AB8I08_11635 [Sandaracinaceae bacterium]
MRNCAQLRSLDGLQRVPIADAWIEGCQELRSLSALTALESLSVVGSAVVTEWPVLGDPTGPDASSLRTLRLRELGALRSMAGLPRLSPSATVWLTACHGLEDLTGWTTGTQLALLHVSECHGLRSLDGIAALDQLEAASFEDCPQLVDIDPLGDLASLRQISFRGCKRVTSLGGLTRSKSVRLIELHGSGVRSGGISDAIRWACNLDFTRGTPRMPPRSATKMGEADEKAFGRIKKLLTARDKGEIDRGVDLLRAAGEAAWFDTLLDGVAGASPRSPTFKTTYAPYTILALLSAAPAESGVARELAASTTVLCLTGQRNQKHHRPFDPKHLEALPRLARLSLDRKGPFSACEQPPALPKLESVYFGELFGFSDFRWLLAAPSLAEVAIKRRGPQHPSLELLVERGVRVDRV